MLKAVQHGEYFKSGRKMYTYKVMGPVAEVEEYKLIEALRLNKTPDQIAQDGGFPIYFVSRDRELMNGDTPQPSYILVKNFRGDGYNRDTSAADRALFARVGETKEKYMGELLAKRALGIDTGERVQRVTATATAPNITAPAIETVADDIADAIRAGANETGEIIPAEVGNETLAN